MDIALIENSNPFAIIPNVKMDEDSKKRILTAIKEHTDADEIESVNFEDKLKYLLDSTNPNYDHRFLVKFKVDGQNLVTTFGFTQTWIYQEENPKPDPDKEKNAWDFVSQYYRDYHSCNDIGHMNDLDKLMDGEWEDGDCADQIRIEDYGGIPDPENSLQFQVDFYRTYSHILERSIENFYEGFPTFKPQMNPASVIMDQAKYCGIDYKALEVSIINHMDRAGDIAEMLTKENVVGSIWRTDPGTTDGSLILTEDAQDIFNEYYDEVTEMLKPE